MTPRNPFLVPLGALVATLAPSVALAHLSRPEALDETLLRADAILVASVESIEQTGDGRYRLDLAEPVVVASRWHEPPSSFELSAEPMLQVEDAALASGVHGIRTVRALPYQFVLERGHRYLFFLTGGPHPGAPSDASSPFHEIDPDGHVVCGSGFVYGLGPMGLVCARPGDVAGDPPLESDLRERLARAVTRARQRRPDLASERDAHVLPLEPPTGEP